jgi:hypothetical protein
MEVLPADHRGNGVFMHHKTDISEGGNATKGQEQVFDFQNVHGHPWHPADTRVTGGRFDLKAWPVDSTECRKLLFFEIIARLMGLSPLKIVHSDDVPIPEGCRNVRQMNPKS